MKKLVYLVSGLLIMSFASCGAGAPKAETEAEAETETKAAEEVALNYSTSAEDAANSGSATFKKDADGYITIFDGTNLNGWRGYAKDHVPGKWSIEDGCLKFSGSGGGEAQETEGGDIIFAHKLKNFIVELEWKISKGGNSGIFYYAQELKRADGNGYEPIYISSPEYQVLDNENHVDALAGKNGNRKSASLYDMIPATPQNSKPFGEWNKAEIVVSKGSVFHKQNGETVAEYHLWTPQWIELLQDSKFSEKAWPEAFAALKEVGGPNREGFFGLQDHGDDVWYRNIRIKILD